MHTCTKRLLAWSWSSVCMYKRASQWTDFRETWWRGFLNVLILIHPVFLYHKRPQYTFQQHTLISQNAVLHVSVRMNHRQALLIKTTQKT